MIFNPTIGGAGGSGKSDIIVYAPTGSTVTVQKGTETPKTAMEKNGVWTFKGCDVGTWTVYASLGEQSATTKVQITEEGQLLRYEVTISYVKIYGIQRDITHESPEWVRTDDAVGFEAVASVGTQAGHSDFDNCYPWSGIERVTFDGTNGLPNTGDVMVKIPRFWFKRWRDGNVEHIQIADNETDGFTLHPAFNHADTPKDFVYVGAYTTSSNNKSVSGATPTVSKTRATFRTNAKAKGDGFGISDIALLSAIQMLIMVEYSTNNVQTAIGRGYCDASGSVINTGSCDNVANLTGRPAGTDGLVDVIWRGIEALWGIIWEFFDGFNLGGGIYYVCNDPSKYADDTNSGYTELSYKPSQGWERIYWTRMGLDTGDNGHVMLPSDASGGSDATYYCDAGWANQSSDWTIYIGSAPLTAGGLAGLFSCMMNRPSSFVDQKLGSRLMYIPQEVAE